MTKERRGRDPTTGERVEKWLTNLKMVIALYLMLGGTAIYGNWDEIQGLIQTDVIQEPTPIGCPACPKAPDVHLSCPEIDYSRINCATNNHEEEYHQ